MKTWFALSILALVPTLASAYAEERVFFAIEGAKQGKFKGESTLAGHEHEIVGLDLELVMTPPASTIHVSKAVGAADPQIYEAQQGDEELKTVVFRIFHDSVHTRTVTLTGAEILDIKEMPVGQPGPAVERLRFRFQGYSNEPQHP